MKKICNILSLALMGLFVSCVDTFKVGDAFWRKHRVWM